MRLSEYLKKNNIDIQRAAAFFERAIKKKYELLFDLTDEQCLYFVGMMDLPEQEIEELIISASRFAKIWSFS